jgi:hypothetical protein
MFLPLKSPYKTVPTRSVLQVANKLIETPPNLEQTEALGGMLSEIFVKVNVFKNALTTCNRIHQISHFFWTFYQILNFIFDLQQ